MTVIQDRPARRRLGARRPAGPLQAAARGLRAVHDEQMRMWEAFYRVAPGRPRTAPLADR